MNKQSPEPPKWANRFLEWFCHPDLLEEIQGDAFELFYRRVEEKGSRKAKFHFIWDVLRSFRLSTVKNINIAPMMLKNNFKIAFRQLNRQRFYSAINIIGLALGIACCLLIALFIKDELSYDKQHPKVENLYRVYLEINLNEWTGRGTAIPPIVPVALVEEIPEITKFARLNPFFDNAGTNLVRKENEQINQFEENFVYADQTLFELFHLPLIYGVKGSILDKPNLVVITKRIADKYFPNQNPIGEILILNDDKNQTYKLSLIHISEPTRPY